MDPEFLKGLTRSLDPLNQAHARTYVISKLKLLCGTHNLY